MSILCYAKHNIEKTFVDSIFAQNKIFKGTANKLRIRINDIALY